MNNIRLISRMLRGKTTVTSIRNSSHGHGGKPDPYDRPAARVYNIWHEPYTEPVGYGLPFRIDCPYRLMFTFIWFFGSGFWLTFAAYHYDRIRDL